MSEDKPVGIVKGLFDLQREVGERCARIEKEMSGLCELAAMSRKELVPYPEEGPWNQSGTDVSFWRVRPEYVAKYLPDSTEEGCLQWAALHFAVAKRVRDENVAVQHHNMAIVTRIAEFLGKFGLVEKVRKTSGKGRHASSYEADSTWLAEIKSRICPTDYDEFRRIEEWHRTATEVIKTHFAAARKTEAEKKAKSEVDILWNEAVAWLTAKGKILGKDFQASEAVGYANDLASNEEVARIMAQGEYISFSGDDGCENCKGWMPGEHRCQCGNRRVCFTDSFGHSFKHPSVRAEAN